MNDKNKKTTEYTGVGITSLLGICFIVLKLCKVISWSWLWVLAPFWIPIALIVSILLFVLIICIIKSLLTKHKK